MRYFIYQGEPFQSSIHSVKEYIWVIDTDTSRAFTLTIDGPTLELPTIYINQCWTEITPEQVKLMGFPLPEEKMTTLTWKFDVLSKVWYDDKVCPYRIEVKADGRFNVGNKSYHDLSSAKEACLQVELKRIRDNKPKSESEKYIVEYPEGSRIGISDNNGQTFSFGVEDTGVTIQTVRAIIDSIIKKVRMEEREECAKIAKKYFYSEPAADAIMNQK